MIPYGRQDIQPEDIEEVVKILKSDFLTQGPKIAEFESAVARYVGSRYAVAVSNATAALHIGAQALGLKQGDTLVTSPNTFVASSNCALYLGARPEFIDIDPRTFNINMDLLEKNLLSGLQPKVVVPVHFSGHSCDMKKLSELSKKYQFRIMEDASHGIGASYEGQKVGSCQYSDLCVFSFHPVKIITTGEGGMLTTNDETLYKSLLRLRSHGITRDVTEMKNPTDGPWYYEQIDLGFNYRITDIQAALGLSQFRKIDQFVSRRRELAAKYDQAFAGLPLRTQKEPKGVRSSYHLYVILLDAPELKAKHREIFESLREQGIGVNLHYIPVYRQPYYERFEYRRGDYPEMENYYTSAITLPLYPTLSEQDQNKVIDAVKATVHKWVKK